MPKIGGICVVCLMMSVPLLAQDRAADEKSIREQIAKIEKGEPTPRTSDSIFWSGAYKRPYISGKEKGEPVEEPIVQARIPGSQQSKTTVRRIDISQSGDMAYEHSDVELTFQIKDAKGQRPNTFMTSTLRVWKKVNNQWLVAAHYNFAHDQAARQRRLILEEQQQRK